ncbi:unnamed protein product [Eruca vesicaria subsp. sativa]|uniref:RRM domain-containing protein n=1 Tax=Eruca vesicaria subsp. sativa TaxID=29727 RepID=A0ABC8IQ11_ERUVS|nr:unnamed protein product [Eruca vesicaria subsp. sativa]
MDESANKGLESKVSDAETPLQRSLRILGKKYRAAAIEESVIKGLGVPKLNGSGAKIRYSGIISRMVVMGYNTSSPREDVEEALRQYFASCGIKLIHVSVFESVFEHYQKTFLCRHGLIYVNEECEAEALKLQGSDMGGGCILDITAYPFADNHLDHVFAPTKDSDEYLQRGLKVTGFDTSRASKDDIMKMVSKVFPGSGCFVHNGGCALVYLHGQDAVENALKLSGGSVGGFKIAVDKVLPIKKVSVGTYPNAWSAFAEGKPKTIMTAD